MNDSDDRTLFSRSLLSRRHRPSQANVRSTVQRIGSFTQPFVPSGRRTIVQVPLRVRLDPLVEREVVVLRVGEHPRDLAHRLAVQPGEQLGAAAGVVDARRPSPARPAATPCCPRRCGVSGRRRSWRCRGPAARRRRSCRPTGCRRWRWSGGGRASPPCGPCGGAGRGSCRGCRRAATRSKYRQTVLLGGKSLGQVPPLAAGAEDVEDGVEDVPHVGLAGPPAGVDAGCGARSGERRAGVPARRGHAPRPAVGHHMRYRRGREPVLVRSCRTRVLELEIEVLQPHFRTDPSGPDQWSVPLTET